MSVVIGIADTKKPKKKHPYALKWKNEDSNPGPLGKNLVGISENFTEISEKYLGVSIYLAIRVIEKEICVAFY